MLVGAADIFANHPFLVIGTAGAPDLDDIDWDDEDPAWTDGKHLLVSTFGRAGLVRVTIWESAMPVVGDIVFDGELNVADSQLCVGDMEELTRLTMRVGDSGPQRVVVCADDPGYASRISVGFDLGEQVTTLTSVAGHPLPSVLLSAKGELSWSEEFGLILDGHDTPRARLAAAIKLMPVPAPVDDDAPAAPAGYVTSVGVPDDPTFAPTSVEPTFTADDSDADADEAAETPVDVSRLVEWLRGLGGGIRLAAAEACGDEIADRMRAAGAVGDSLPDHLALAIATDALERLGLR
ncbi:hypothetical protein ACWKSP_25745 [Micromonosporaceae bacterium Da 78-11]